MPVTLILKFGRDHLTLQSDWGQDVSVLATLEPRRRNLLDPAGLGKQNGVLGGRSQPGPSVLGARTFPEPDLPREERL